MNKLLFVGILTYIISSIFYANYLNNTIKILNSNNVALQQANEQNLQILADMENRFNSIVNINNHLNEMILNTNTEIDSLKLKLMETSEKLEKIALVKPNVLERKINIASDKVITCFENITKGVKCDY